MRETHLSSIDLNLLVILDVLLEEGSVTAAARRLHRSQPAVSRSLQHLRDLLQDPLLVREGSVMRPTPRALALQAPLRRVLRAVESEVLSPEVFDPSSARRTFTLATTDYAEATLLPRTIARITSEAPGVDIVFSNAWDLPGSLDDEVDVAIGPLANVPARIRAVALGSEAFAVLVRADHPEIGEVLDLETYVRLPHVLVAPRGAPGGLVDDYLARLGHTRRVLLRTRSFLVAPELVLCTNAVLTLPRRVAELAARRLPLRVLDPPLPLAPFVVRLLWHGRWQHDPGHAWLRHVVAEEAKIVLRGQEPSGPPVVTPGGGGPP